MDARYREWIDANYPTPEASLHQCAAATRAIVEVFPELKRVCGWVSSRPNTPRSKATEHWWCVAPDGSVVDPTRRQFSFWSHIEYDAHDETKGEPVCLRKCMYCGIEFRAKGRRCWCSKQCLAALERESE